MTSTAGYVLVGGKSSRLGRDKALLEIDGMPLAMRVAEAVRNAAGEVTLVGSPRKYRRLGLRVIPDALENFGPLAGLLAALEDSACSWNLIAACDMPYVTDEFLRFLMQRAKRSSEDIVLPLDAEGREEPLCAVYSLAARDTIRRSVEQGIHKITKAFGDLKIHYVSAADCARFDPQGRLFANLNTDADFGEAGFPQKG